MLRRMARDRTFVARPEFRSWLLAQLAVDPIVEPLVTYVARRVAHAQATNGALPSATAMAPAQPTSNGPYAGSISPAMMHQQTVAPAAFFAQPVASTSQPRIQHPVQAPLPATTAIAPSALVQPSTSTATATAASTASTGAAPAVDWNAALPQARRLLEAETLGSMPARAARKLAQLLAPFEAADAPASVPSVGRLEIVELLVKRATASTWAAFATEKPLRAIFESWLQTAAKSAKGKSSDADDKRRQATLPLLQVRSHACWPG